MRAEGATAPTAAVDPPATLATATASASMPSSAGAAVPMSMPVPTPKYRPAGGSVASRPIPTVAGATMLSATAAAVASGYQVPEAGSLLSMLATRGRYVEDAVHEAENPPLPSMPKTPGSRCKGAAPPPEPREHTSDAASGRFEDIPGESSRERQWRLHGVWRKRGGRRQDEFRPKPRHDRR